MAVKESASQGPDAQDIAEAMEAMKAYHRADVWLDIRPDPTTPYKLQVTAHAVLLAPVPMKGQPGLKVTSPPVWLGRSFPHPDHKTLEGCISYVLNGLDYKMACEFWEQMPLDYVW